MAGTKKTTRAKTDAAPEALPTLRFRATLTRGGDRAMGVWRWLDIPERVSRALAPWAKSGHIRIDATLDGVAVQGSLSPRGGGRHMMVLNAALRRQAGLVDGRTTPVEVTVTPRVTDAVRVPDALAEALDREAAREAFEAMSSSHRWELVRYVMGARSDATRARYVARAVDHVLGRTPDAETAPPRRSTGWHCPECGRHFPRVDAEHSCEKLPLDLPFAGKPASVRVLFDALRSRVEALTAATMAVHKEGVGFVGQRRFLWAIPRAKWLEVRFIMARRVEAPGVRAFTLGPAQHVNTLRVRDAAELDGETTALLREAIAYGGPSSAGVAVTTPRPEGKRSAWARDVDDSFFAGLDEM
jgi:hypothetical protein